MVGNAYVVTIFNIKIDAGDAEPGLQDLREKAIKKARKLQAEADASGVAELAIPEPPKFSVPDGLSWRKCALLIVTSSHQGLCQSCFVAFSNPDASYFIKTLAFWVFLLVPVGFSLVTHITLQGVQDAEKTLPFLKTTYCSLGKKLKMIPKNMKQNDLKFVKNTILAGVKAQAKGAATGAAKGAAGLGSTAGLAKKLAMAGEWKPQTKEMKRWMVIYSPMFSKFTHAGMVLTGLNLFQKIMQSFFLSYVGTASARIPLDDFDRERSAGGLRRLAALDVSNFSGGANASDWAASAFTVEEMAAPYHYEFTAAQLDGMGARRSLSDSGDLVFYDKTDAVLQLLGLQFITASPPHCRAPAEPPLC